MAHIIVGDVLTGPWHSAVVGAVVVPIGPTGGTDCIGAEDHVIVVEGREGRERDSVLAVR